MPGLFKQKLASDELVRVFAVGRFPSPVMIDMFALAGGFDGFWIDQEHAGLTYEQILVLATAARANAMDSFVRMAPTDYAKVTQNLEAGSGGVMAARIDSAEQAEQFVQWAKFAPRGRRGLNTSRPHADATFQPAALSAATRHRRPRFPPFRRGVFASVILRTRTLLSLFSNYLATRRAIGVSYEGSLYFPTFKYHDMATFGQQDEYGFEDVEADYLALKARFAVEDSGDWVLMPPVPFAPYEPDFDYDEPPPNAPDGRHWFGTDSQGRDVLARLLYGFRLSILFAAILVFVGQAAGPAIGSLPGLLGGRFRLDLARSPGARSALPASPWTANVSSRSGRPCPFSKSASCRRPSSSRASCCCWRSCRCSSGFA